MGLLESPVAPFRRSRLSLYWTPRHRGFPEALGIHIGKFTLVGKVPSFPFRGSMCVTTAYYHRRHPRFLITCIVICSLEKIMTWLGILVDLTDSSPTDKRKSLELTHESASDRSIYPVVVDGDRRQNQQTAWCGAGCGSLTSPATVRRKTRRSFPSPDLLFWIPWFWPWLCLCAYQWDFSPVHPCRVEFHFITKAVIWIAISGALTRGISWRRHAIPAGDPCLSVEFLIRQHVICAYLWRAF